MRGDRAHKQGHIAAQGSSEDPKEHYEARNVEEVYMKVISLIFTDRTFQTLLSREILRLPGPDADDSSAALDLAPLPVVFGIALGGRINRSEGIPYLDYILPGIALMSLITNSQMNSSWSVFDAKRER